MPMKAKFYFIALLVEFFVTKTKAQSILRLQACTALGLIWTGDCNDSVTEPLTLDSEFQDVFEDRGRFSDPYKISTKPEVEPVIQPPRRVPMNLHFWMKRKEMA